MDWRRVAPGSYELGEATIIRIAPRVWVLSEPWTPDTFHPTLAIAREAYATKEL